MWFKTISSSWYTSVCIQMYKDDNQNVSPYTFQIDMTKTLDSQRWYKLLCMPCLIAQY